MPSLSWMDLAYAGAPPTSKIVKELIAHHRPKTFAPPPTVTPDGETLVTPAVFKPRKPAADTAELPPYRVRPPVVLPTTEVTVAAAAMVAAIPVRTPTAAAPPRRAATAAAASETAFTFPGAVDVLHAAQQQRAVENARAEGEGGDGEGGDADDVAEQFERVNDLAAHYDCDAIRRKLQRFLARKTMTQAALLREIKTNTNSFRKFMSYKGPKKGERNGTYVGALVFFDKLEREEGITGGVARSAPNERGYGAKEPKVSRRELAMKMQAFVNRINAVSLPEPVYVYDDCDDVRKKLNELLESKTITQGALVKHLDVNSTSLRRFLTSKGKREGCTMGVYKYAYIMFEKLRIADGKPKSKKRLKCENERPQGYSLKRDPTHYYLTSDETLPWELTHP